MKKLWLKRLCKVGSLVLALAATLLFLQEFVLCRADNNRERVKGFYLEEQDTVDVVLIGASEIYAGFASPYAYAQYGFTSYPLATQSNTVLNYLTCVKEAVRTQHPRLLVIEINGALYDDAELDQEANYLRIADNMPNNENKRELTDLFGSFDFYETYLPITRYHTVWEDFPVGIEWSASLVLSRLRGHNLLKGVSTTTEIYTPREPLYNDDSGDSLPLNPRCQQALEELLDYCREEELNVLFVRFPHLIHQKNVKRLRRSFAAAELIRSRGFECLAMDDKISDIGLNPQRDFYSPEHVNLYGQQKLTDYLSVRIAERLGNAPSRLSDSARAAWDESVRYYHAYYALADAILHSGGEYRSVGEDIVSLLQMQAYLK